MTYSQPPPGRYSEIDADQHLSLDELQELQLGRLRWSLNHAYAGVPHYRKRFDEAGVHPNDLSELSDLSSFPMLSKDDLRSNYPFGMFAVPREDIARVHASSGTTGQATVVGYTKQDLRIWAQLMARSIKAAGGRRGDIVHIAYGYGLFTGGLGAHYGAEELGCTVVPISAGRTERQVQLIQDFAPSVILVTPSYFLAILDEMETQGIDPRTTSLRVGIFGAEPWTDAMRDEIEQRCQIDAVDIYGLSEVMGPGVSQEFTETKDGLHVWEDHFYPEIVDPATGEVLPDESQGELVFTSLTKQGSPVIRYRTRDLTTLSAGTARPAFRRMAKVTGRSDDMMIVRGVNVFPSQIEEEILCVEGLAPHYVCVLTRAGRLDEMTVRVETSQTVADDRKRDMASVLAAKLKSNTGLTATIDVTDPQTIDRSEGKAVRVVDRR